jgi:hypothetical protein
MNILISGSVADGFRLLKLSPYKSRAPVSHIVNSVVL